MKLKFKKSTVIITICAVLVSISCSVGGYFLYNKYKEPEINYEEIENMIIKDKEPSEGSFEEYVERYGLWSINYVLVYEDGHKYFVIDELLPTDKVGVEGIVEVRKPTKEEIVEYSKERWKQNETRAVY